jgi:serine/threonine protein kinase
MDISQALPAGTMLASHQRKYKIKKVLGQGGFGITYLATSRITVENITTEASFCIKEHYIHSMNERRGTSVIISNPNNVADVKNSLEAFLGEARRLNSLSRHHDNIVRVNEVFEANGTAYYVMQFIDGQKLSAYVRGHDGGILPEDEALRITYEVGHALSFLHENRLTHLDVKPDNIMLNEDMRPVLIDFGLAKHYDKKGRPTSSIKVMGISEGYAPIEQYVGITEFTPEADVYALAATLFFMLTGEHPPKSTEISGALIAERLQGHASASTVSALQHGLERLKEMRTHSVEAFLKELKETVKEPVVGKPKEDDSKITKRGIYDGDELILDDDKVQPVEKHKERSGGSTVISRNTGGGNQRYYLLGLAAALIVAIIVGAVLLGGGGKTTGVSDGVDTLAVDDTTAADPAITPGFDGIKQITPTSAKPSTPSTPSTSSTPSTTKTSTKTGSQKSSGTTGSSSKTSPSTSGTVSKPVTKKKTADDYFDKPAPVKTSDDYFN